MSLESKEPSGKQFSRLKIIAAVLSLLGLGLFCYFIYSVGIKEIIQGVGKIGVWGFGFILFLYLLRIIVRAYAWKLSVYNPYKLKFYDTFAGVIMGEAVSSVVPLGILASGTAKAVAVSHRVPLVVGLSSVATENLFYSLITSLFIVCGAVAFLLGNSAESWIWTVYALIFIILSLIAVIILMIVQQWHWASAACEKLYNKGYFRKYLEDGRLHVRLFENLIYGFYRRHPDRFLAISMCEFLFHVFGITEVWFILSRVSDAFPSVYNAFLLESVSRVVTITFKLIPFAMGVDEASAQFITENLALGAGVGVTLAILRKGRMLFWALAGIALILKRGLTFAELLRHPEDFPKRANEKAPKN